MAAGYENASQEWTHTRIKALIEKQTRDYALELLYLGADEDASEEGSKMGFAAQKAMTYNKDKADKVMAAVAPTSVPTESLGSRRGARLGGVQDRVHPGAARRRGQLTIR